MNEYSAKLLPKMAKNANDFAFKITTSNLYTMLCSIIVTCFIYSVKSTTNLMKASIFCLLVEGRFPPSDLTHHSVH